LEACYPPDVFGQSTLGVKELLLKVLMLLVGETKRGLRTVAMRNPKVKSSIITPPMVKLARFKVYGEADLDKTVQDTLQRLLVRAFVADGIADQDSYDLI
jgi:hypothetical protein